MTDLDEFRTEVRSWLEDNAPNSIRGRTRGRLLEGSWGGRRAGFSNPDMKIWLERFAKKGWTAPAWPAHYGGGGLSKAHDKILTEEMAQLEVPKPLVGIGLTMIGPTLLRYGTDEQKQEHLPKICSGEIRWCQGYSEPGAGSDLASLQTRAVRDGDDFIITGQKVWTSYADQSDWIFALVRSDPAAKKHDGITFILIDLDNPGVDARPIRLISGASPFCETHFDEVRVPVANVIGEINGGWSVAKALLGHERTMVATAFGGGGGGTRSKGRGRLVEHAASTLGEVDGLLGDPVMRDAVAQVEMDAKCFALTMQRSKDAARAGHEPGSETSLFKIYGTEVNQRRQELMVQLAGPESLGWEGPGFSDDELALTRSWLRSRGNSIEGGTSEIQLNIIAKRVLGLPV